MIALIITAVILLPVILFLLTSLTLYFEYDGTEHIKAGFAGLRINITKIVQKASQKTKTKAKKKTVQKKEQTSLLETLEYAIQFLQYAGGAAKRLISRIVIDDLSVKIKVCGSDAAKTAAIYGGICAALSSSLSVIKNILTVRVKSIKTWCDFLGGENVYHIKFKAKIKGYSLLAIGGMFFIQIIKININKGVVENGASNRRYAGNINGQAS
ncbi:MAG: hypothetical protein FWH14_05980 [Oscillospiraceae bacterium]|nr:hypothetical protein [Oscillospiraceae bacterium]